MRSRMLAAICLAALPQAALAGSPGKAGVRWERNFDAAQKKARVAGKALMVDFWAEWCGWCHRLDQTTYVDPVVVKMSEDFVPVKVDTEQGKGPSIAIRYGVTSLPTIAFISPGGNLVWRVDGYAGPGQFPDHMQMARETAARVIGFEAALEKDARDAAALHGLGVHLFEREVYDASRDLLLRALPLDQARPVEERKRSRLLLGIVRRYEDKLKEAEVVLRDGLSVRPKHELDAKLLFVLGRVYITQNRHDEARAVIQECVDAFPNASVAPKCRETLQSLPPKSGRYNRVPR